MSPKSTWIDDWEKMAWQKPDRASHRLMSVGLCPLGWIYGWISKRYAILQGRPEVVQKPVISVGNLTVGGSGKTPFTIYLADRISKHWNKKVAVVSRGYGKKDKDAITIVSDGERIFRSPEEAGDEAYLTAVKVPKAIVVTCPNRYKAGQRAIQDYGAEVILLDDGFQHRQLIRDYDLVMVDAERGFGNGRCFPAGPLREPLSGLRRADGLILYRRSFGGVKSDLKDSLSRRVGMNIRTLEVLASIRSIEKYVPGHSSQENLEQKTMDWVQARALRWLLVSGIAYPRSFEQAAAELELPAVE